MARAAERPVDTGTEQLLCAVEDHVATVSFNRPDQRNALGDIVTPALREILLEADPDVRVIILTGVARLARRPTSRRATRPTQWPGNAIK